MYIVRELHATDSKLSHDGEELNNFFQGFMINLNALHKIFAISSIK